MIFDYYLFLCRLDSSRWMHWMRHVHLSPRLTQRKHLMINELTSANSSSGDSVTAAGVATRSPDRNPETLTAKSTNRRKSGSAVEAKENIVEEFKTTSFVTILIQEGLDQILNVLNNAITLQKRVSGQKQSCVPSKR